jgi:hypothetical protein
VLSTINCTSVVPELALTALANATTWAWKSWPGYSGTCSAALLPGRIAGP